MSLGEREPVFVAMGDSFTEGVGDYAPHLPHGVRGWADRVAEQLAIADPRWRYANLAIRGRRLELVLAEQLAPALAMKPTLVSLYAGGNDLLGVRPHMRKLMNDLESAVVTIRATGAQVLLFTSYNVPLSPVLEPLTVRSAYYNRRLRAMAEKHGALLVDYWCFEKFQDGRMWSQDRLHMSTRGHIYMAKKVMEVLRQPHSVDPAPLGLPPARTRAQLASADLRWARQYFGPWLGRRLRGTSSGEGMSPRWPEPTRLATPVATSTPAMTPISSLGHSLVS